MANKTGKVSVVTDNWSGLVVAHALKNASLDTQVIQVAPPLKPTPELCALYHGNGDAKARLVAVMGKDLAEKFWRISESNFSGAKMLLGDAVVSSNGLFRDEKASEPGLCFDSVRFEETLTAKIGAVWKVDKVGQLQRSQNGDYFLAKHSSNAVVIVSEYLVPKIFPSYADKLIPVTLHSYLFEAAPKVPFSVGLFHGGADYALVGKNKALFGSFRNLFEDKGVGLIKDPDPKTLPGIESFFGGKGWLQGSPSLRTQVECVTCDGLPIVGATADMPGVYVVAGFAARTANFIFELSSYLAKGLSRGAWSSDPEIFSTKRFV